MGTRVKTDTGFQPILGFLHAEEDTMVSYLRFTTPSASMTISPLHHAFVNGAEIDPSFIKLGDLLHTPHGLKPVTRIETVEERGAYHSFVKGGSYFVDGILASDYYGLVPRTRPGRLCALTSRRATRSEPPSSLSAWGTSPTTPGRRIYSTARGCPFGRRRTCSPRSPSPRA